MCRYATVDYKQTYSCFSCRKSFKKVTVKDFFAQRGLVNVFKSLRNCRTKRERELVEEKYRTTADHLITEYQNLISRCPDCGGQMANMGMDFKSPKKDDLKAWKIVSGMYRMGAIFQTCGCNGFGYVPKSPSAYREYLEENLASYTDCLANVEQNLELTPYQRLEQATYWSNRIAKVRIEIDKCLMSGSS